MYDQDSTHRVVMRLTFSRLGLRSLFNKPLYERAVAAVQSHVVHDFEAFVRAHALESREAAAELFVSNRESTGR